MSQKKSYKNIMMSLSENLTKAEKKGLVYVNDRRLYFLLSNGLNQKANRANNKKIVNFKETGMSHQNNQLQKTMNATIVTGQYIDSQGQQKKSYLTIGKLFIYNDGGMSLKLDALPMNGQNINFYDIKPKSQPNQQQNNSYQQPNQQY